MRKIAYAGLAVIILAAGGVFIRSLMRTEEMSDPRAVENEDYVSYESAAFGLRFIYPRSWGDVTIREGNMTCPEEDTYRTADTLHVFDQEFSFPDRRLPGSESMIRSGIRIRELNSRNSDNCGSNFLWKIARGEIDPAALSSVQLIPITLRSGLMGIYNPEASRLNTEARAQYTFFAATADGFYILQPYMSFIPYFGSPELAEMEEAWKGDMEKYLTEGITSGKIRQYRGKFNDMAESIGFPRFSNQ